MARTKRATTAAKESTPKKVYVAKAFFLYPGKPGVIDRLLLGESIPAQERGNIRVEAGSVVDLDELPEQVRNNVLERGIVVEKED